MLSMAIQSTVDASSLKSLAFSCANISSKPTIRAFIPAARSSSLSRSQCRLSHRRSSRRELRISAPVAAAADAIVAEAEDTDDSSSKVPLETEKLGVVVKPMAKPRLVLKFIWMEKNIGIALDQMIPGHGAIPLSPYYFWPRKDAWEELKVLLETKPWISQKQMIILLNQATDIINLWQQSGGDLS
ncbi:30S ribosomal protein 3, chloroplastic-like [Punica granatum]|uniref:30S ribosomal protein 3, chloroplastic n=2 Tax=Punica granatum TaxID=22663 RepID=A0A6P8DHL0_PUNGR|nr:30S ribosomal protein 3, chloroplastic-like [Punica granatum]